MVIGIYVDLFENRSEEERPFYSLKYVPKYEGYINGLENLYHRDSTQEIMVVGHQS